MCVLSYRPNTPMKPKLKSPLLTMEKVKYILPVFKSFIKFRPKEGTKGNPRLEERMSPRKRRRRKKMRTSPEVSHEVSQQRGSSELRMILASFSS